MRAWMVVTAMIFGISLAMGLADWMRPSLKCPPGSSPKSVGPTTVPSFCQPDDDTGWWSNPPPSSGPHAPA
jgi:hypothetical protein